VHLAETFGSKRMTVLSTVIFIVMFLVAPLLEYLDDANASKVTIYVVIFLVGLCRASCASTGSMSLQVMITQTTNSDNLGLVNGFSQSLNALCKSVVPVIAGALYDAPGGAFTAYWTFAAFGLISLVLACNLPEELNFKIAKSGGGPGSS